MSTLSLKRKPVLAPGDDTEPAAAPAAAGGVALGVLIAEADGKFRARLGGVDQPVDVDPTVDPALLREALGSGARVVLETGGPRATVVGTLSTARALTIDRDGAVEARVRRFALTATEEALLASTGAFVRLKREEVELYGLRVLTRARELARIIGHMVKIN